MIEEAELRALLDEAGILRDERASPLDRDRAFVVFSQRAGARFAVDEWQTYAARVLGARLGLTVPKRPRDTTPRVDVARVAIAPVEGGAFAAGARVVMARPREAADVAAAERAAHAIGAAGLIDLARRCPTAWLVEASGEGDPIALRIAAAIAGVHLGPILTPSGGELLGPRTARLRL